VLYKNSIRFSINGKTFEYEKVKSIEDAPGGAVIITLGDQRIVLSAGTRWIYREKTGSTMD
jgi:hypothetical protein